MTQLLLRRLHWDEFATYGQLLTEEAELLGVTLELPWRDNQHNVSCIPPGVYPAHRFLSPKRHYELFKLTSVPDRSDIEIHIGNLPHDTDGCILIGSQYGRVGELPGITNSKVAFEALMHRLEGVNELTLTVQNPTTGVIA